MKKKKKKKKIYIYIYIYYERYGVNIAPDSNSNGLQQVEGVSLISFRRQSTLLQ